MLYMFLWNPYEPLFLGINLNLSNVDMKIWSEDLCFKDNLAHVTSNFQLVQLTSSPSAALQCAFGNNKLLPVEGPEKWEMGVQIAP